MLGKLYDTMAGVVYLDRITICVLDFVHASHDSQDHRPVHKFDELGIIWLSDEYHKEIQWRCCDTATPSHVA